MGIGVVRAPLGGLTVGEPPTANGLDVWSTAGRFTSRTRESVFGTYISARDGTNLQDPQESDDDVGRVPLSGESSGLGHVTWRPCEVLVHLFFAAGADTSRREQTLH